MTISQQNDDIERESLLPITILGNFILKEFQPVGQANNITQSSTKTSICRGCLDNASSFYKKRQYKSLEDFHVNNKVICEELKCFSKSEHTVTLGKCANIIKEKQPSMDELESKTVKRYGVPTSFSMLILFYLFVCYFFKFSFFISEGWRKVDTRAAKWQLRKRK